MLRGALYVSWFIWIPYLMLQNGFLHHWGMSDTGRASSGNMTNANFRPVIAVLAGPCVAPLPSDCKYYIPASYVRWIQQAGARVVPLHADMTDEHFSSVLSRTNGAMAIGGFGGANGRASPQLVKIWNHAMALANDGEVYPLWGTCQGLDDIVQIASNTTYDHFLSTTRAADLPLPLVFPKQHLRHRGLLFNEALFPGANTFQKWFRDLPISYHHHDYGISPRTFFSLPHVSNIFEVIATGFDRDGLEFVSMIRGHKLPIFATMFHPEKPAFEWPLLQSALINSTLIPHSEKAVLANQHLGHVFVAHARQNTRRFQSNSELQDLLVYNSRLVFTAKESGMITYFDECFYI